MYQASLDVIEFGKWNRKMLNAYWCFVILALSAELVLFFAVPHKFEDRKYLWIYLVKPLLINITILLFTEWIHRLVKDRKKECVKYLLITCGTLIAGNLIFVHYVVPTIYAMFILPIFLCHFYVDKRLTYFATVLNMLFYAVFTFLYLPTKAGFEQRDVIQNFVTTISIMVATVVLVKASVARVKEIVQSLVSLHQSKQDLTIKNFVMEFNSKIEPATGLYNHKTFYDYLQHLIEQSENYGFPLSLAVFDIDNFKRVNDTYGHNLGDEVIKGLVEIIKNNIGADDFAARYGGEEFAIIFTDKSQQRAFEIAEDIRIKFNNTVIGGLEGEKFSVSAGISEHSKGMSKQDFFKNADDALYKAKGSGKNVVVAYRRM